MPIGILALSFFLPLVSVLPGVPDLSGGESVLLVFAWSGAVLVSHRVTTLDVVLIGLATWEMASAVINDVALINGAIHFGLVAAPFMFLRLLMFTSATGIRRLRRSCEYLVGAQVVMLVYQAVAKEGVDALKGTFVGTMYGAHVASFVVLLGVGMYGERHHWSRKSQCMLLGALVIAELADAKIPLVTVMLAATAYLMVGQRVRMRRSSPASRAALLALIGCLGWAFYVGVLGNIALKPYVEQSFESGGGKVAVTELILNPTSGYWDGVSRIYGAGPGQSVSRTAGLTVDNGEGGAPALGLGATPARYDEYFQDRAQTLGYVGSSSATAPRSSLLGLLAELGLVGLGLFVAAWGYMVRVFARTAGRRSVPVIVAMVFLLPGFLGEWLEFPPACMFLVASAMCIGRTSQTLCEGTESEVAQGAGKVARDGVAASRRACGGVMRGGHGSAR